MEIKGTVAHIGATETKSDKFSKRELWLDTPGQYPQRISIDFINGNADKLKYASVGDEVNVHFDVRGREYNGKVYNTLVGFRIENMGKAVKEAPAQVAGIGAENESDTLPF